jgi:hypothetical protein
VYCTVNDEVSEPVRDSVTEPGSLSNSLAAASVTANETTGSGTPSPWRAMTRDRIVPSPAPCASIDTLPTRGPLAVGWKVAVIEHVAPGARMVPAWHRSLADADTAKSPPISTLAISTSPDPALVTTPDAGPLV